ncbi:DMT family transporter [Halomonas sp. 18H]|uniref:DMT family transporter n=1 Tax=Halomonas almeriensis TaxID=308163 RepID=UPI002230F8C3|nr:MULTISPECIES: DMT family transporter [Halomonas]MCW4153573.1 DMT family transporter [Halomonas sp. 18H]MDN3552370.1 DMT family transporter [Halomonas almeriensis]
MTARAAHLGMLCWAVLVGLSFPAVGLMSELPPMLLTALRFAIACVGLWPLALRGQGAVPAWQGLAVYGVMGLCLAGFFGSMFWAAHHATALSMATLYVCVPLLAYGLGVLLRVEQLAWRLPAILALGALGALGLALAEARVRGGTMQLGRGEAVFFAGCVCSALYPVVSKWGLNAGLLSASAAVRTFWSLALGGALIGLLGLLVEPAVRLGTMRWSDGLLLIYLGLCSSALTFWLMQRATQVLTPGTITAYGYLVPFVSMLVLFVTLPASLSWVWWPGSLVVLATIVLLWRHDAS